MSPFGPQPVRLKSPRSNRILTRKPILLGTDASHPVNVEALADGLNRVCRHLRFVSRAEAFDLGPHLISNPKTYNQLIPVTQRLRSKHDSIFIGTDLPYDNNYFFDSDDDVSIISFSGWSWLTNLPKNNGMVGLLGRIIAQLLDDSIRHEENIGCVYDFLVDKRGIDAQLRNGSMCRGCIERLQAKVKHNQSERVPGFSFTVEESLEDLLIMFDEVSMASKRQIDILDRWKMKAGIEEDYDVFLCHNSLDKPSVRRLYRGLKSRGIRPWFDEEHLQPGVPWQDELSKMIPRIKSTAIIVGPNGQGPWQNNELRAFISKFADTGCSVVPVILKDASDTPELPLFLSQFTWVDFRKSRPDPWKRLIWGITGKRPRDA